MQYDSNRLDSFLPPQTRLDAGIEAQRLRRIDNHHQPLSASKPHPGHRWRLQPRHDSQGAAGELPREVYRRDGLTLDQIRRMQNYRATTR